jgi:hypothetical protein
MKDLKKNNLYISLLEKNGYKAYSNYLSKNEKSKDLKILEDFINILTQNKNSSEIKEIRKKYLKRFER